ncbi:MAG: hypothetical protein M3Z06_13615 [Actinomycetota bacterium]|nr:hypothetical protein [Actinomycetota bacterium]
MARFQARAIVKASQRRYNPRAMFARVERVSRDVNPSPKPSGDVERVALVEHDEASVSDVEVPLVKFFVITSLRFAATVNEHYLSPGADNVHHGRDRGQRVSRMIERVPRVCDIERAAPELQGNIFTPAGLCTHRRPHARCSEQRPVLSRERVDGNHLDIADGAAIVNVPDRRHRSRPNIKDPDVLGAHRIDRRQEIRIHDRS